MYCAFVGSWSTILSYVDARYVQDILDNVVGPENWENRFYEAKGALFCEITINIDKNPYDIG